MPGFYDTLKGEPEDGYGIPIDAYIKYQRDHIDRVEHTDEDTNTYVSASGDNWYDTQYELFTEEEQLKLLSMEND